ncbi:hypothetical protein Dred_0815 [Desulforamulus reducens MI-1]|uniref:Uncharacterized protein n=1 Tax=Desulforamulus reducens (strain ATCC BAA-1160 / DSM 100696 / MI-1) TaxID=349161 RepID=A4J2Q0_DESRM|nr:hypothetical protein Dred_0815 [Desulforamulus reducens MI-1]
MDIDSFFYQLQNDLLGLVNLAIESEIQTVIITGTIGLFIAIIHLLLKDNPALLIIFKFFEIVVAVLILVFLLRYVTSMLTGIL